MVLKARRDYKERIAEVVEEPKVAPELTEEERRAKMLKDPAFVAQVVEFIGFLDEQTYNKTRPSKFFVDMQAKLNRCEMLSDNMVSALRRCMGRDTVQEHSSEDNKPERVITLKVRQFLMQEMGIDSRIITGKIKQESAKAWLIEGYADMLESLSWCVRCGRELKEPASQVTGMGSTCAEKAGIQYDPSEVLKASPQKRRAIRNKFLKKLHNQKFERWIPKSQVEILEGAK